MGVYQNGTNVIIVETFGIETVPGDFSTFIPTDPTSVIFSVRQPDGTVTTYIFGIDGELTNTAVGVYELDLGPVSLAGFWTYRAQGTGAVEAVTEGDFSVKPSAVISPALAEFMQVPCTPWCDSNDIWMTCGSPTVTVGEGSNETSCAVDMSAFVSMSSWLLFELSGRLYSGRCERTVRPCGSMPCGFQTLPGGYIVWPTFDGLYPDAAWGWSGSGWNWPDYSGCDCVPLDRINLAGYPVREIIEVKIDGVVVPEAFNWRLDKRRYLTRMADVNGNSQRWPACQHRDMDDTEVGTFAVKYAYGQDPPLLGSLAAAQVACEIYRGNNGEDCALPAGTIRVTRQGITIDKMATLSWFRSAKLGWRTGLPMVDAFLNGANPNGLTRRPMMMAPGNRRGRFAQSVGS